MLYFMCNESNIHCRQKYAMGDRHVSTQHFRRSGTPQRRSQVRSSVDDFCLYEVDWYFNSLKLKKIIFKLFKNNVLLHIFQFRVIHVVGKNDIACISLPDTLR